MKKVVAYLRVSTQGQADSGISLDAQRTKVEQYAALYDLELVAVIVDAGVSAKSLKRDGLQEALAVLDAGQAEGLLIAKLDRLTRSVRDLGTLLDSHFSSKFSLQSVQDQIDTSTASGRLVLNVLTSVAQWEREEGAQRTSNALQHKIANGEWVGAPALGFDIVDGKKEENPEEAPTLARIAELRSEGHTYRVIASTLTAEGFRTKRNAAWNPGTVQRYVKAMGL